MGMIFTMAFQSTLNVEICKIAFYMLLQIATEQPLFIALIIRKLKLKIIDTVHYPKMFYFAIVIHYVTKIMTTAAIWYYYIRMVTIKEDDRCSAWYIYNVSFEFFLKNDDFDWKPFLVIFYGILSVLLFSLQMYQGYGFYLLGKPRTVETVECVNGVNGGKTPQGITGEINGELGGPDTMKVTVSLTEERQHVEEHQVEMVES